MRSLWTFARCLVVKLLADGGPNWAVLIAWNALFSIFPIILAVGTLFGLVLSTHGPTSHTLYRSLLAVMPADAGRDDLLRALSGVKQQSGLLLAVGLAGLMWGGSALFGTMEEAFAVIYRTRPRGFVRQKVMSLGMILLFGLLGGIAVGTSSLLPALGHLTWMPAWLSRGPGALALQAPVGVLAGFVLFSVVYFVVPNRPQLWGQVWPGAVVAGVLFEAITLLFPLYLHLNRGIGAYGKTFGLLFIVLTFLYFLGLTTMLGVEVNTILYPASEAQPVLPRTERPTPSEAGPQRHRRARRGLPAPAALGLALVASIAGVLLGRRSAGSAD